MATKAHAAAQRVTETETRFDRFLKWPYYGTNFRGSFDKNWRRFPLVRRWRNLPPKYGGEKLIDFTGMLFGGMAWCCEVKQHDINNVKPTRPEAFEYSQVNERQQAHLDWMIQSGGIAWLGLGFVDGTKPIATFMIPWDQWRLLPTLHIKEYQNGNARPWASITPDECRQFLADFELVHHKPKGRDWAYFTGLEDQEWHYHSKPTDLPIPRAFLHSTSMIG